MENYFNYFTEIEEQFQRKRGGTLLLSTLDWALIETWKDAGIPLEAVLRGIDATFEHYEERPARSRKINSLAYCSQEVLTAAEDMKEAAVGTSGSSGTAQPRGFDAIEIAAFLKKNAERLQALNLPERSGMSGSAIARETASTLLGLASELERQKSPRLEDLERHLTTLEEKLFAVLLTVTPDSEIVAVRAQADRDLVPYRSKMQAPQIEQLQKQYVHKRLLEKYAVPRLSLFYM